MSKDLEALKAELAQRVQGLNPRDRTTVDEWVKYTLDTGSRPEETLRQAVQALRGGQRGVANLRAENRNYIQLRNMKTEDLLKVRNDRFTPQERMRIREQVDTHLFTTERFPWTRDARLDDEIWRQIQAIRQKHPNAFVDASKLLIGQAGLLREDDSGAAPLFRKKRQDTPMVPGRPYTVTDRLRETVGTPEYDAMMLDRRAAKDFGEAFLKSKQYQESRPILLAMAEKTRVQNESRGRGRRFDPDIWDVMIKQKKLDVRQNINPHVKRGTGNVSKLVFTGQDLHVYGPNDRLLTTVKGYSGKPGTDKSSQYVAKEGPIPEGVYYIDPFDHEYASTNPLQHMVDHRAYWPDEGWGDRRIPLHPAKGTYTRGRKDMYLHGGRFIGSAGCVDIGNCDRKVLDMIGSSKGPIKVIVDYSRSTARVPSNRGKRVEWGPER